MYPSDYRNFLKYVGNGNRIHSDKRVRGLNAAGPYYGLLAFTRVHYDCLPQERFPLTLAEGAGPDGADIFEDVDEDFTGDLEFPGMIQICHQGCAGYFNLVVNGESSSTLWETWEYKLFATGISFEQWYSHWLEQLVVTAISKLEREERIKQIRLGMTKDEVIARCGGEWTQHESSYATDHRSTLWSREFATQFELDQNDRLMRVVDHYVYLPRPAPAFDTAD